jgi:hypothetical protein
VNIATGLLRLRNTSSRDAPRRTRFGTGSALATRPTDSIAPGTPPAHSGAARCDHANSVAKLEGPQRSHLRSQDLFAPRHHEQGKVVHDLHAWQPRYSTLGHDLQCWINHLSACLLLVASSLPSVSSLPPPLVYYLTDLTPLAPGRCKLATFVAPLNEK